jgi:hypothetical protein
LLLDEVEMSQEEKEDPIQTNSTHIKMKNSCLTLLGRLILVGVFAGRLPRWRWLVEINRIIPRPNLQRRCRPSGDRWSYHTEEWQSAIGATGNWRITYDANQTNMLRGGYLLLGPDLLDATDLGYQIYAGYDATNLYIAVRVTDNVILEDSVTAESANGKTEEDDSVELYIDPNNDNATTYPAGSIGWSVSVAVNNAYAGPQSTNYGTDKAWYGRAAQNGTGTGYDVEFRISLASLNNPKFGDVVGFTVVVNDDKDGGPVNPTQTVQIHLGGYSR